MASAICFPFSGILAPESKDTAAVLLKLNDLLDVLNSNSRLSKCFNKRAISLMKPKTAERHLTLLREADQWLGKWTVGDGSVRIDSIRGLRQTIRGVQSIWEKCKAAGCQFLFTRRLNQDPLENFFGVIRQRGGNMDNPDPTQFRYAYKHAVVNSLLVAPQTANCEADSDGLITGLGMIAAQADQASPKMSLLQCAPEPEVVYDVPVDAVTANCLTYVAGYLAHKANVGCSECINALVRNTAVVEGQADVLTALKAHTGVSKCDAGSLKLPTPALLDFITECYVSISVHVRSMIFEVGIRERLVRCMLASDPAALLASQMKCHPRVLADIAGRYTRLMLHRMCREMTAAAKSGPKKQSRKLLKLQRR